MDKVPEFEQFRAIINQHDEVYEFCEENIYIPLIKKFKEIRKNNVEIEEKFIRSVIIEGVLVRWGQVVYVKLKSHEYKKLIDDLKTKLKDVYSELEKNGLLNDGNIEEINLNDNAEIIKKVYKELSSIDKGIKHTAASKILHFVNPKLFVPWDEKMRKKWKYPSSSNGYLTFLKTMQCWAKYLLSNYKEKIEEMKKGREITRLIDIYNWWTVNKVFNRVGYAKIIGNIKVKCKKAKLYGN